MESRLIKEFIDYEKVSGASEKTIKAYRIDLEKTFPILFGTVDPSLEQLKSLTIEFVRNKLIEMSNEMAVTTVNRRLASLKSLNNYFSTKYMYVNNIKLVKKLVDTRATEHAVLNKEEYEEVINKAKETNDRDYYIFSMLFYCGLRSQELLDIKKSDIYLDKDLVSIVGKRGKLRFVPLNEKVKSAIMKYLPQVKGEKMLDLSYNGLLKKYKKYTNGIEGIHGVHSSRHTFATTLLNSGEDIQCISELLGHSNVAITSSTYLHSNNKANAVNSL